LVLQGASPSFSCSRRSLFPSLQGIAILALTAALLTIAAACGGAGGASNSNQNAPTTPQSQKTVSSLSITTSGLSAAVANRAYSASLSASGGTPPYKWTISAGALAPGILLQAASGALAGTTGFQGNYSFTVTVTDAASKSATKSLALFVSPPTPPIPPPTTSSSSNFDGPAELPRIYLKTTMADTPAPGSIISVNAGGNLQAALDSAICGDTIELQAGANFAIKGNYTFPAKSCDSEHWIVVRTSAPDASLPPEGTRMTPCYVGVASLPGRPAFSCTQPQHLLATITYSGTSSGPITFANGANHYRLLGLEITRTANNGLPVTALISPAIGGTMNWIVLDRCYLHGAPSVETRRGMELSGGTSIAMQDSYISDFHCKVGGTCTDAQAVSGGDGSLASGPYRIVDNFLEASGENIIFGGGAATQTPADIEIRFNHFFKPMFWMQGEPGFTAPAFIVKNHFELKNAQRVLFDSNLLEDTWGGYSQSGYSVVLTPRNQEGEFGGNVCPLCKVTDVTVRYTIISHVAGAFQIANTITLPNGLPLDGERYSIHDVIADDIDGVKYAGYGTLAQVSTIAVPLLQKVAINHITAFPPRELFNVGGPGTLKMPGFVFTNSIVTSGEYPIWSIGGSGDCANQDVPLNVMEQCFSGYTFSSNAILAAPTEYSPSTWPSGNWFYSSADAINFVSYNNGNGGDYHLLPSSPAKAAASDGTDLGANVDAVLTALSGVQ
jgi:hypothetical protein